MFAVEAPARRAFDAVQEAESAARDGDVVRAERLYREAIDIDRRPGSRELPDYPLGRYGAFLEAQNRPLEAIAVYEEAVRLGTDIPAIYGPLLGLYADRGDEEAVFRTADLYAASTRVEPRQVVDALTRLAMERGKAGATQLAERWLVRIEGWATRHGDHASRFRAWGERGHAVEQSGDIERAVSIYEAAVAAGSDDRKTFTRLLMAYEKAKRWPDAYTLARRALGVQRDAAWELDIKTRIARFDTKSKSGTATPRTSIPAFSLRRGSGRIQLVAQVSPKLPASNVALSADRRLLVSAGSSKPENLTCYDLLSMEARWTVSLPGSSADLEVLGNSGYLAATSEGRIGEGGARLTFLDRDGRTRNAVDLPDKLSEVRAASDLVVAGCRDGFLYAFDPHGKPRWRYQVPPRPDLASDSPSFRPCPYFVELSADGRHILFSSWDTVFRLDDRGRLGWTWTAPTERQTFHYTFPLDRRAARVDHYQALGLTPRASSDDVRKAFRRQAMATHPDRNPNDPSAADRFRAVVQAYEAIVSGADGSTGGEVGFTVDISVGLAMSTIYGVAISSDGETAAVAGSDGALTELDARGRIRRRLVESDGAGRLTGNGDLSTLIYSHWGGVNAYHRSGLVGVWEAEQLHEVRLSPDGRHVAAWSGKTLHLFTRTLGLVGEVEFARKVADVAFTGPNEVTVACGKLIRLSFA